MIYLKKKTYVIIAVLLVGIFSSIGYLTYARLLDQKKSQTELSMSKGHVEFGDKQQAPWTYVGSFFYNDELSTEFDSIITAKDTFSLSAKKNQDLGIIESDGQYGSLLLDKPLKDQGNGFYNVKARDTFMQTYSIVYQPKQDTQSKNNQAEFDLKLVQGMSELEKLKSLFEIYCLVSYVDSSQTTVKYVDSSQTTVKYVDSSQNVDSSQTTVKKVWFTDESSTIDSFKGTISNQSPLKVYLLIRAKNTLATDIEFPKLVFQVDAQNHLVQINKGGANG